MPESPVHKCQTLADKEKVNINITVRFKSNRYYALITEAQEYWQFGQWMTNKLTDNKSVTINIIVMSSLPSSR